jgi:hypothetical protein
MDPAEFICSVSSILLIKPEFHTVSDGLDKEKCEYLVIMDLFLFVLFQPGPDYDLLRALG